mmetsp:Transcript_7170/g.14341  ORF Transcript_7170/g.14341 Transcript_7170/m.14341 type:complete len:316 (+) Transcript_7170:36-983(+)
MWPSRAAPRSALEVPSWNIDTLLPTAPPTRIYLKWIQVDPHGRLEKRVLAFADLDAHLTVDDLKTLVYERLMLTPNQAVCIFSWGRALDGTKRLCDLSLQTNAQLEMRLALQAPDPRRGLERLHVTSSLLSKRRVAANMHTTVLELKHAIQATLLKGPHQWWETDGTCINTCGTTLLAAVSLPADEKQGTDDIQQGEELIIENKLHLQGGKGPVCTYRMETGRKCIDGRPTGRVCNVVDSSVHILDLKPERMALMWMGRALADDEVLFELGLRHDDSVVLEFASPVAPSELTLLRAPPKEKENKADGGGKGKKNK